MDLFQDRFYWSAPLVSRGNRSDRTTESESESGLKMTPLSSVGHIEDVPVVEFRYPVFTCMPGAVTVIYGGDSGLCCCVLVC